MSKKCGPAGVLYVEGRDDVYAIGALLEVSGHPQDKDNGPVRIRLGTPKEDAITAGVEGLLELLKLVATTYSQNNLIAGFVLDMDDKYHVRWAKICHHFSLAGMVDLPAAPPPEGFIAVHPKTKARIGVWLMPDNKPSEHGTLEHWLEAMIPAHDRLLPYAREVVDRAKQEFGARFLDAHRPKAIMHTWLAWQENSGRPFGTAITCGYLKPNAASAQAFVEWFVKLYKLEGSEPVAAPSAGAAV